MPVRLCYPSDLTLLVVLRETLTDRRARGIGFADAWPAALAEVLRTCRDREVRGDWRAALRGTAASWARAYAGLPAEPREVAVAELLDALPDRVLAETPIEVLELTLVRADAPVANAA